jgi:hypothetical protein
MTANECPSASDLASILERRANRRDRARWLSHLDQCPDCRIVLGEAASYIEAASLRDTTQEPRHSWLERLWALPLSPAIAALVLVLLAVGGYVDPFSWFEGSTIDSISSQAATAPLFAVPAVSYAEHRFASDQRGLGFSPSLGRKERSFRVGSALVDLRVAAHEGRLGDASLIVDSLDPLVESGRILTPIRDGLQSGDAGFNTVLDKAETDLRDALDPTFFALGIWTESARFAAAAEQPAFFSRPDFRRELNSFLEIELPKPVASRLESIDRLCSAPSQADLRELERELQTLILLN